MIVVDSSIWVAFLDEDDSQNERANSFFANQKEEILLTEYIILEVCTIVEQHVNKQAANHFLLSAQQNSHIHIQASNINFLSDIITSYLKHPYRHLSFIDISLLYLSQFYPVHTFDKKLTSAIKKAGRK